MSTKHLIEVKETGDRSDSLVSSTEVTPLPPTAAQAGGLAEPPVQGTAHPTRGEHRGLHVGDQQAQPQYRDLLSRPLERLGHLNDERWKKSAKF